MQIPKFSLGKELSLFEMELISNWHVVVDSDWNFANGISSYSRLYYVKAGAGFLEYNGKRIDMSAGNVYFIPAGTVFSAGCEENETMEKIYFHISLISMEKYDLFSKVKGIYSLTLEEAGAEAIFDYYSQDNYNYTALLEIRSILYKTMISFYRKHNFESMAIKNYSPAVQRTMAYIQENIRINLKVHEIAKSLFLSESKIRRAFYKETNMTIGNYIDELVFSKAQRLLLSSGLSIKDISDELGFCDQFYFSRRFKEKLGGPPSHYRKDYKVL